MVELYRYFTTGTVCHPFAILLDTFFALMFLHFFFGCAQRLDFFLEGIGHLLVEVTVDQDHHNQRDQKHRSKAAEEHGIIPEPYLVT